MKQPKPIILLLSLYLSVHILSAQAQEHNKVNLKYGIGYGYFQSTHYVSGSGKTLSTGVEIPLWKDRIRFNPSLNIGMLSTKSEFGSDDQWMNPVNLDVPVSFDALRLGAFSLQTTLGLFINNTQGYINTNDYTWDYQAISRYRNFWALGLCGNIGIRIMPTKWKVGVEMIPFQVRYGFIDYWQFESTLGLIVKL